MSDSIFSLGEHIAIFHAWKDSPNLEEIRNAIPDELQTRLDSILQRDVPFLDAPLLLEALQDCVRRMDLRRLAEAKQASTAALSEPDLQPFMSAAVEEAVLLRETRSDERSHETITLTPTSTQEVAASLVEDEALGRKLHQTASGSRSTQRARVSPQSEAE
jgi:hypothetical protein